MRILFPLGLPLPPIVVQVPAPPTPRAYGTFILAEYLDENLTFGSDPGSGGDAALRTFIRICNGFNPVPGFSTTAQQTIHDVIAWEADGNQTLSSMLTGFAVDSYGYSSNTAQAVVSAASGTASIVIVEVFRLDGSRVDIGSVAVNEFQGWIAAGDVAWQPGTEDVLLYRLTTTAAGALLVDTTIVGTGP